ncbi:hypothetical protein ACCM60_19315 [Pseudomonas chlororaphis subsp. aureofaciens]
MPPGLQVIRNPLKAYRVLVQHHNVAEVVVDRRQLDVGAIPWIRFNWIAKNDVTIMAHQDGRYQLIVPRAVLSDTTSC